MLLLHIPASSRRPRMLPACRTEGEGCTIPTFDLVPSDVEGFMDELWEFQSVFQAVVPPACVRKTGCVLHRYIQRACRTRAMCMQGLGVRQDPGPSTITQVTRACSLAAPGERRLWRLHRLSTTTIPRGEVVRATRRCLTPSLRVSSPLSAFLCPPAAL